MLRVMLKKEKKVNHPALAILDAPINTDRDLKSQFT